MGQKEQTMAARTLGIALVLAAVGAGTMEAQGRPLTVQARRDLDFGTIIPGVPTTVSRLDPTAGHFIVRGRRDVELLLELALPIALTATTGAVPLSFGPADAGHGPLADLGASQPFDPRVPLAVILPGNGTYYLWLGGTVQPLAQQVPGTYSAQIMLTASYTGN
jgi:hypothetical protein